MFACILKVCIELAAHLPVSVIRDADAAGLGDTFEPRSNVHTVPKYVAILDDNVADMNTNAEFDPLVVRYRCVALGHASLDFNGAAGSVHGACKLNQYAIPGPLDDAAAIVCDLRFQELAPMSIQPQQRAFLVGAHQAAIAGNIAGEDGS